MAGNAAAIFQKPDMDIQISSASSSSVVSSGSALSQKKTCPYCYQQLSDSDVGQSAVKKQEIIKPHSQGAKWVKSERLLSDYRQK